MLINILLFILFLYIFFTFYINKRYDKDRNVKFISYTSSPLEMEWLNVIKQHEYNYTTIYCSLLHPYNHRIEILEQDIIKCKNSSYHKCEGDDLSFFIYKLNNGKILKEYIEPLFGFLRNTFFICSNNSKGNILSTNYLLPSYINAIHHQIVYIDAGASTFNTSQSYFYKFYKKYHSTKFKKWFLWEIKKQNISLLMKEIPNDIVNIYNYYNKPIVIDIKSNDNPLKIIKEYQNNSYVIFKLDVDTPKVELPILHYLINNYDVIPHEFYFEYHFYSKIMMKWWGNSVDYNCTLYCATKKFLHLREKGIRSHGWI